MKILKYNDIIKSDWNALLKNSQYSSFFQSPECYDFYSQISNFTPFAYAIKSNGRLKGVMIGYIQADGGKLKSYLSRRAIINAGPLLSPDITEEELQFLLKATKNELGGKVIYIETRNFFDYSKYKEVFRASGFQYHQHLNFQIATLDEKSVMDAMGKSRKRDIKVTMRDGAELVECPTKEEISAYYLILKDLYKTKIKTPLFSEQFFQILNEKEYGKLILVRFNGIIVGGTVCVGLNGTPLYEWFVCGEDGAYKNIHASTLATFGGIQYAFSNGYPVFDMMGAGKPNDGYGVRDFKAKFGGELVENGRFVSVLNPILYKVGEIGVKILKHSK